MDQMKPFEVPADMRKFAEQSVEQARQAFDRFISAAHEAVADFEGRAQTARSGAMDVGGRAMNFAERNMAASFEFAQQLVKAKDVAGGHPPADGIREGAGPGSQRADQGIGG